MTTFNGRSYLSENELRLYDKLIKEYIDNENLKDKAITDELLSTLASLSSTVTSNSQAISVLNGDVSVEGSVAKQVNDAINKLVDGAPEALDTFKELANWIQDDETASTALASKVVENEQAIASLQSYVDEQDEAVYESFQPISDLIIMGLFPVKQSPSETAEEAIMALEDGKALELAPQQIIVNDLTISKPCYINANGSTFTGTVTIPKEVEVVIENATFSNPVIVA